MTRRRRNLLIAVFGCLIAIPVAAGCFHIVWVFYWYQWGLPQAIQDTRDHVLYHADHARIVQEARHMLDNPALYPHPSGSSHPQNIPPYLDSLGAASVSAYPNEGVLLVFWRDFALFVPDQNAPGVLQWLVPMSPTEIYPGLWYFQYP